MSATIVSTLVVFAVLFVLIGRRDYSDLHIMVDTGMFLVPPVLAMLFWDMGQRIESSSSKLLAVSSRPWNSIEVPGRVKPIPNVCVSIFAVGANSVTPH